jgi:hypothetical protein
MTLWVKNCRAILRKVRLLCPRKLPRLASAIAAAKANKRHHTHSLNHLIGGYQKRLRHTDTKRLGSLEVNDQLKFSRLQNR